MPIPATREHAPNALPRPANGGDTVRKGSILTCMPLDIKPPVRVAFLPLKDYSMIAFANAVEPLRAANRITGKALFDWRLVSLDGKSVVSSNGLTIGPFSSVGELGTIDILFVCGGINVKEAVSEPLLTYLKELAQKKVALGALCTGSYALARARLLDGYHCAVHWENLAALHEEYPNINFGSKLFVIDRDRLTASGGLAPLDLSLALIRQLFGKTLSQTIAEVFICERVRDGHDSQHVPLNAQVGPGQHKIIEAASLMEANIEEPLTLDELAKYVGLSRRQIERLFKLHLGRAPTRYYLELRLTRARQLLLQTKMSIMAITVACGFRSPPHFSKAYREFFGHPPSISRKMSGPSALPSSDVALDERRKTGYIGSTLTD